MSNASNDLAKAYSKHPPISMYWPSSLPFWSAQLGPLIVNLLSMEADSIRAAIFGGEIRQFKSVSSSRAFISPASGMKWWSNRSRFAPVMQSFLSWDSSQIDQLKKVLMASLGFWRESVPM